MTPFRTCVGLSNKRNALRHSRGRWQHSFASPGSSPPSGMTPLPAARPLESREIGFAALLSLLPPQQDHHGSGLELFHVSSAPVRVLLFHNSVACVRIVLTPATYLCYI